MKALLVVVSFCLIAIGQPYYFPDSLNVEQTLFLDSVANEFSIDDGCDGTVAETQDMFNCIDARSFYNFAAWQVMNGKPADYVVDKLNKRNQTFYAPIQYEIAPSYITTAGDSNSPIDILIYVTSTCPFCKRVGIPLREIVEGPYRGKATLDLKPIHHKLGDYALLAAQEQDKAWELFEAYGDIAHQLSEESIIEAALSVGIDTTQLKSDIDNNNDLYSSIIDENYSEAKANGLEFTPTLYFNGYRYRSNKHPIWLMDYIDYLLRTPEYL